MNYVRCVSLLCCSAMYYSAFVNLPVCLFLTFRSLVGMNEVLVNVLKNVDIGDRMTRTQDNE